VKYFHNIIATIFVVVVTAVHYISPQIWAKGIMVQRTECNVHFILKKLKIGQNGQNKSIFLIVRELNSSPNPRGTAPATTFILAILPTIFVKSNWKDEYFP
jgi:hypothetical protein